MFKKLLVEYEKHDNAREQVILVSRDIIRLSKKVISSVHNEELKDAEKYASEMEKKTDVMRRQKSLADTGSYSAAMQEFVEALLLLEYAKAGKIAEQEKFNCTPDEYLMGLCDFVGELQRRAVLKVSKGDKNEIEKIYRAATEIYNGLLDFSFRGEVRKKFDLVKYVIIRLEEIMLELKIRCLK
jgi:translin